MKDVSGKWTRTGAGDHYESARFRNPRAAARDPRLLTRLLARHGVLSGAGGVLDMPCGTGRLYDVLSGTGEPVTSVDIARPMLTGGPVRPRRLLASAERLPFADESFDVVVCCRLLHHLHATEDLQRVVRELVRVSSRLVIASFWDAASLPAWRVRAGLRRDEGPLGRRAVKRSVVTDLFEDAGASVSEFAHSFRFLSQQAFACAIKRGAAR